MNRPIPEDYIKINGEVDETYTMDLEDYCDELEKKLKHRTFRPEPYNFENDSMGNSTTEGIVDAIAVLIDNLSLTSDMSFKDVVRHIMWNYDVYFEESEDE